MLAPTSSLAIAVLLLACATAPAAERPSGDSPMVPAPEVAPLAPFAAQRIAVVPTQRLRAGDSLGWAASRGEPSAPLRRMDDELTFVLGERGLGRLWVMPGDVARMLRRNPTFDVDPYALDVGRLLLRPAKAGVEVTGPIATQLRAIAALGNARYVLLPAELSFEPAAPAGAGRAVLHALIVDTRLAQVAWRGDVAGDVHASASPAIAASLASRLADLFVAPAPPGPQSPPPE